jgi:hypothetical protein
MANLRGRLPFACGEAGQTDQGKKQGADHGEGEISREARSGGDRQRGGREGAARLHRRRDRY